MCCVFAGMPITRASRNCVCGPAAAVAAAVAAVAVAAAAVVCIMTEQSWVWVAAVCHVKCLVTTAPAGGGR